MSINFAQLYQTFKTATNNKTPAQRFNTDIVYDNTGTDYSANPDQKEKNFALYLKEAANEDRNPELNAQELDKATGIGLHNATLFIQHFSTNVDFRNMTEVASAMNIWNADSNHNGQLEAIEKHDLIEELYHIAYTPKSPEDLAKEFKGLANKTTAEIRFGTCVNMVYNNADYDKSLSEQDALDYIAAAVGSNGEVNKNVLKEITGFSDTAADYLFATRANLKNPIEARNLLVELDSKSGSYTGVILPEVKAQIEADAQAWKSQTTGSSSSGSSSSSSSSSSGSSSSSYSAHRQSSSGWSLGGLFSGLFGGGSGKKQSFLNLLLMGGLLYLGIKACDSD